MIYFHHLVKLQLMYQISIFFQNSFKALHVSLEIYLQEVQNQECKAYFGTIFSRYFTASSVVVTISLLGSVLEIIEKLTSITRRLVSIWVNCLEHIKNQFLFIYYDSSFLCFFVLADQFIKFVYTSLFLLNQKISYFNFDKIELLKCYIQISFGSWCGF